MNINKLKIRYSNINIYDKNNKMQNSALHIKTSNPAFTRQRYFLKKLTSNYYLM